MSPASAQRNAGNRIRGLTLQGWTLLFLTLTLQAAVGAKAPRPGVDRFASAWLIRRFIDSQARFAFETDPAPMPDAVPFDMYDAGFRHEGARCTFEVLALRFGVHDLTVRRIGEIVHDVDL